MRLLIPLLLHTGSLADGA